MVVETDFGASDGQKRSVYIYRFLTAGTIDGKSGQSELWRANILFRCIDFRKDLPASNHQARTE